MALFYLSISAGNLFTALVNQLIQNPDGTTRLVGASYHLFFAGFMGIVALIFAVYMRFYQEQHIIQEESKPWSPLIFWTRIFLVTGMRQENSNWTPIEHQLNNNWTPIDWRPGSLFFWRRMSLTWLRTIGRVSQRIDYPSANQLIKVSYRWVNIAQTTLGNNSLPRHREAFAETRRINVIQRINRSSNIFEGQLAIVRGAYPTSRAFNNRLRNGHKNCPIMNTAFQHDETLF